MVCGPMANRGSNMHFKGLRCRWRIRKPALISLSLAATSLVAVPGSASAVSIDTNVSGLFEAHCGGVSTATQCLPCQTAEERDAMPRLSMRTVGVTPGSETDNGLPISHIEGALQFPVFWNDFGPQVDGFCANGANIKVRRGVMIYSMTGEVLWNENGTGLFRYEATYESGPVGPRLSGLNFTTEAAFWRAGINSFIDTADDFVFSPPEGRLQNGVQVAGDGTIFQQNSPCTTSGGGGGRIRCMHLVSNTQLVTAVGTLAGVVESVVPTITNPQLPDRQVQRARVTVYEQPFGRVRLPSGVETAAEYQAFLATQPRFAVASKMIDRRGNGTGEEEDPGAFRFEALPATRAVGSNGPEPVFYTIEVTGGETDEVEYDLDGVTIIPGSESILPFKTFIAPNISVLLDSESLVVALDPLTGVGAKRSLIDRLSEICEENYAPAEVAATAFLDEIEAGTIALTEVTEEAINRGIWAERMVLSGVTLADESLAIMLDGVGTLVANVFDDITDFTRNDISAAKAKLSKMRSSPKVPGGFGVGSNANRNSLADLTLSELQLVDFAELAGILKAAVKALAPFIEAAMVQSGVEPNAAAERAKFGVWLLTSTLSKIETGSKLGAATPTIKFLIEQAYAELRPLFLDSLPSSALPFGADVTYCGWTADSLEASAAQMQNWQGFGRLGFENDRDRVVDLIGVLNDAGTETLTRARVSLEIANGLDGLEGFTGLLAKGPPWGKAIEYAVWVSKNLLNADTIATPLAFIYGIAPLAVENGVYGAFGAQPPALHGDAGFVAAPRMQSGFIGSGVLTEPLDVEEVVSALEAVRDLLSANEIGQAVAQAYGDDPGSYKSKRAAWLRSIDLYFTELSAADGGSPLLGGQSPMNGLRAALLSLAELRALESDLTGILQALFVNVLSSEYPDTADSGYLNARLTALAAIPSVVEKMREASNIVTASDDSLIGQPVRPAVFVEFTEVFSIPTGEEEITQTPETFTVRARAKNLSDVALSDLSVVLRATDGDLSSTVGDELTVGSGTLTADDGIDGSGSDEAIVEWTLEYDGDLSWDVFVLSVEALEAGSAPVTFSSDGDSTFVAVDPEIGDSDLDGMPDAYETMFGLDTASNDAADDLDTDGLPNAAELRQGTDPSQASSDGDSLSDLEELTAGADGVITDPLDADTDGDGTPDDVDGSPRDPTTADAGSIVELGEPIPSVSRQVVELGPDSESAGLVVDNGGEGDLVWAVEVENPALVSVSPRTGDLAQAGALLSIGAPAGFDFASVGLVETKVRIVDVSGTTKDFVEITVRIGNDAGTDLCGHAVDASLGGPVTATDALAALNAAVGLTACELCRCDVNQSGSVTAADALTILSKAVGVPLDLNCPACS